MGRIQVEKNRKINFKKIGAHEKILKYMFWSIFTLKSFWHF